MILRFFKGNQPAASFAIPIVVLVLWLPGLFKPAISTAQDAMPLYVWLYSWVSLLPALGIKLLCMAIVSFQAIYVHHIMVKHDVLYIDSYLPSLMFAVLASCLPEFQQFTPVLIVNLIMLFVMNRSFALFKEPFPISFIFDSSFLVGIASLIYLPAVLFILLMLISLLVLRPFHWREWMVAFIGFVLPYFFISVYYFWSGGLKQFYGWLFGNSINKRLFYEIQFTQQLILLILLFSGLLVVSLFKLRDNFYKNAIKTRIVQQVIVIYLIVAALCCGLQATITLLQVELLAFPMAVFFGYYFLSVRKRLWIYEVLFLLMIAVVALNLF